MAVYRQRGRCPRLTSLTRKKPFPDGSKIIDPWSDFPDTWALSFPFTHAEHCPVSGTTALNSIDICYDGLSDESELWTEIVSPCFPPGLHPHDISIRWRPYRTPRRSDIDFAACLGPLELIKNLIILAHTDVFNRYQQQSNMFGPPPAPQPQHIDIFWTEGDTTNVRSTWPDVRNPGAPLRNLTSAAYRDMVRRHVEALFRDVLGDRPVLSPANMPAANPSFIYPREHLDDLHRVVKVAEPTVIHDMRGSGKTEMAVEYAHRYHSFYDRAVCWLEAETREQLKSSLLDVGQRALNWDIANVPSDADALALWSRMIVELDSKQSIALVVFNNANDWSVVESLVAGCQDTSNIHVLLTSRSPPPPTLRRRMELFSMKPWSPPRCATLLLRSANILKPDEILYFAHRADDQKAALETSRQLLGRASWMVAAGEHIRERRKTDPTYRVRDLNAALAKNVVEFPEEEKEIAELVRRLEDEVADEIAELANATQDALRLAATLAPKPIPIELLMPSEGTAAEKLRGLLDTMKKHAYADYQADTQVALLRSFLRKVLQRMNHDEQEKWSQEAIEAVSRAMREWNENAQTSQQDRFGFFLPHVVLATRLLKDLGRVESDGSGEWNSTEALIRAAKIANATGLAAYHAKKYGKAEKRFRWAIQILKGILEVARTDKPDSRAWLLGYCYNNLGTIRHRQGAQGRRKKEFAKALNSFDTAMQHFERASDLVAPSSEAFLIAGRNLELCKVALMECRQAHRDSEAAPA